MKRQLVLLFIALISVSCVTGMDSRLTGRGPLALSDTNPYLASNLLLAEKVKSSEVVSGFLRYRGMPAAIEINRHLFGPSTTTLYYPKELEYYMIEGQGKDVIVTGPLPIPPSQQVTVELATKIYQGTPVLLEGANVEKETFDTSKNQGTSVKSEENYSLLQQLQSNSDAAIAEITPKGDLIHYVSCDGETLSMITRWYTHDIANLSKIIRLNNLSNPDKLRLGDTIIIPKYLVKTKVAMTEEAVEALKK